MDIGAHFKKLRLDRGLTQQQLAQPHYSAAYISTIEAGKRIPSRKAMARFAARLGVDPDDLSSGRDPARRPELLARYADGRRILASGRPDSIEAAETTFRSVARAGARDRLVDVEARGRLGLALCAEARNDLDKALEIFDATLQLLAPEGPLARVDALAGRARVLQTKGEVPYAAFIIEQAIAELRDSDIDDPSALLRLHSSLVAAYFDAGLVERAGASAATALELAVSVDDPERLANMNLNVGIMLTYQGRWRDAEARLAEAERWFDALEHKGDLARVRLVRGINLRNQERFDEARPHLDAARDAFASAGNKLRDARATVALALLERRAERHDEAIFLLKRAKSLAEGDKGIAGIAERELALCHVGRDRAKAVAGLRKAIRLLEGAGIMDELAATYRALGDVLSEDEELKPACDAYRKAADLYERSGAQAA
ncbi:MAG: helix-turn-helix domain-containing protein [Actinomycetota bacterium]